MLSSRCLLPVLLCLLVFQLTGCVRRPPQVLSLDEAHQLFVEFSKKDGQDVRLFPLEDTLWIYVPMREEIVDMRASGYGLRRSADGQTKPALLYLEAAYEAQERSFTIRYDIRSQTVYPNDPGYGLNYHERFNTAFRSVYDNIRRTYLEADLTDRDSRTRAPRTPKFFVIVFADITRGISVRSTFAFEDYKKEMSSALPPEEAQKRRLNQILGDKGLIGDAQGQSLEIKEMTWPEFISRQIEQRIQFAYTQSTLPAAEIPEEMVLQALAQTVKAYGFEDFRKIFLEDLRLENKQEIDTSVFATFDLRDTSPRINLP